MSFAGLASSAGSTGREAAVTLSYPAARNAQSALVLGGHRYRAALDPQTDVNGDTTNLTVNLACAHCRPDSPNLMEDGKPFHGVQPFMFLVNDPYGLYRPRWVRLEKLGVEVSVRGLRFRLCRGRVASRQFCSASVRLDLRPLRVAPETRPRERRRLGHRRARDAMTI